jgi:hypothetical protein
MTPQTGDFPRWRNSEFLLKDPGRVVRTVLPGPSDKRKPKNDRRGRGQRDCACDSHPTRFDEEADSKKNNGTNGVGQEEDRAKDHINSHKDLAPEE